MIKLHTVRRIGVLSLSLFCATAALAADGTSKPADPEALPSYEALDTNNDGVVTLPEVVVYSESLARRIRPCDISGDDRLSRDEYASCEPATAANAVTAGAGHHSN